MSKKYSLIIFSAVVFAISAFTVVSAQENNSATDGASYVSKVEIKDVQIEPKGDKLQINATLYNPSSNIETPSFTHLLLLKEIDPLIRSKNLEYNPPSLIVSASEGQDYFTLKPNEQRKLSLSLPFSSYLPKKNYGLYFAVIKSDGIQLGRYYGIVRNLGANISDDNKGFYKNGFLAFDQDDCVIIDVAKKNFEPNEGPVFEPTQQPKIKCSVKNVGREEILVFPKIEWKEFFVYGRPSSGDKIVENYDESMTFKSGETKKIELFLPKSSKSQVYQALLSFVDKDGATRSFDMFFRWTIGGSSARVENVSLASQIKKNYEKGEVLSLSVDYFGSMDLYWKASGGENSNLNDIKMKALIKDENGTICGEKETVLPNVGDAGRKNYKIDIPLTKQCKNISYDVSLSSNDNNLAKESGELPKLTGGGGIAAYAYIVVGLVFLFIIIFAFIAKRRKTSVGKISIFFFLVIFLPFLGVKLVDAAGTRCPKTDNVCSGGTAYSGSVRGGYSLVNSDPLYSFYGVNDINNINKLVIKDVDISSSGNSILQATIDYGAGFTSCSNSTMQIRFKIAISANGLSEHFIDFAPAGSTNWGESFLRKYSEVSFGSLFELFDLRPEHTAEFYDNNGKLRGNPHLLIYIRESGKSTHTNPYHRGDFIKPISTVGFSTATDALNASDVIKYDIPLNLLNPSVTLSANPTTLTYPTKDTTLTWNAIDVSSCQASTNHPTASWSGTKSSGSGRSQTLTDLWEFGVFTPKTYFFKLSCSRQLGSTSYSYSSSVNVTVNPPPPLNLRIARSSGSTADGTVSVTFSNKSNFTYETQSPSRIAKLISGIFNFAEAKDANDLKDKQLAAVITGPVCNLSSSSPFCDINNIPPGFVRLVASSSFFKWDASTPCSNETSASCEFNMSSSVVIPVEFKPTSSSSSSSSGSITGDPTNGKCGTANGSTRASQPTSSAELCTVTNESSTSVTDTGSGWTWTCYGSGGGNDASCSATKSTSSVTPPSTPTNLTATTGVCDSSTINLSWTDVSGEDSYNIQRDGSGVLASPTANSTSYADSATDNSNNSYSYRIQACNSGGCSDYSDAVSANSPVVCVVTTTPVCGNSSVESGEGCDDGNTTSSDGCSSSCQVESSGGGGGYTLTVSVGSGTVTVTSDGGVTTDITCNNFATCSKSYSPGTEVKLTASETSGSFTEWGDDCSGTLKTCDLTMDTDKNVSAYFSDYPSCAGAGCTLPLSSSSSSSYSSSVTTSSSSSSRPSVIIREI